MSLKSLQTYSLFISSLGLVIALFSLIQMDFPFRIECKGRRFSEGQVEMGCIQFLALHPMSVKMIPQPSLVNALLQKFATNDWDTHLNQFFIMFLPPCH